MIKILLISLLVSFASAQEKAINPIVIRNEDFKEGTTFDVALNQIYKRIFPKKSAKDPAKCFWMLGNGKYLIILTTETVLAEQVAFDPMTIERLVEPDKNGLEFIINANDIVSKKELKEILSDYNMLAKANESKPLIWLVPCKKNLTDTRDVLKLIRDSGIKHIYVSNPEKVRDVPDIFILPKEKPSAQ